MRVSRSLLAALLVVVTTLTARADDVTVETLLDRLTDLDRLLLPVRDGDRHLLFSSTSPRALAAEPGSSAWFANDDAGHVRREIRTGVPERVEHVIAEHTGPGAIVRIWSADPKGTLRIYLDGAATPEIEEPMDALLRGKVAWCPAPLASQRGGGSTLYLPIPFEKSALVTVSDPSIHYHVDVATLAGDTVQTLTRERLAEAKGAVVNAARALTRIEEAPTSSLPPKDSVEASQTFLLKAKPSSGLSFLPGDPAQTALFAPRVASESGTVLFDLRLTEFACNEPEAALAKALVVISFDGEERVRVPLGHFFACGPRGEDHRGVGAGLVKPVPGWLLYNRFPMPFRAVATLQIENHSGHELGGRLTWRVRPARAGETLPFGAVYREFLRERTRPLRDLSLCRLERAGRVVGTVLSIRNPVPTWWGEGDEKLRIDGETVPSWAGTGTEDYFGGGWAKGERYSHPFHGQPSGDGALQPGLATLARWHVPDPIPFSRSLAFDLELWHHEDVVVDLATTVFFYGARARSPFPEGKVPGFPE